MTKNRLLKPVIVTVVIIFIAILAFNIRLPISTKGGENIQLFPGVIGNMVLRNNNTGINFIKNMTSYDDFRGQIVEGYKATYSGTNGTMIIFMAELKDNTSANESFNSMASRIIKQNNGLSNMSLENNTITKLPVQNPVVYVIRKNKNSIWHYTFVKKEKVFWVGFNNSDIDYQINILREAYMRIDKDNDILE